MAEDVSVPEFSPETVPGIDPELENKRSEEFAAAVKALDSRGQRVVGQLLAGAKVRSSADKLAAGEVEVLSGGLVTGIKRTDRMGDDGKQGRVMRIALENAGITGSHLANVLAAGLNARKHVVLNGKARKIPDFSIRYKYLELAHRLRGDFPKEVASNTEETYEARLLSVLRRSADDLPS